MGGVEEVPYRFSGSSRSLRRLQQFRQPAFTLIAVFILAYALYRSGASDGPAWPPSRGEVDGEVSRSDSGFSGTVPDRNLGSGSNEEFEGENLAFAFENAQGDEYRNDDDGSSEPIRKDYHEVFSATTRLRKFLPVFMEGVGTTNPSLIPHPTRHDMWIIIAQNVDANEQVMCPAGILDDVMLCAEPPVILAVPPQIAAACGSERVSLTRSLFYGPESPYITSTVQSQGDCLSRWLQDARMNLDAFRLERLSLVKSFKAPAHISGNSTPPAVDSDQFLFWNPDGKQYIHTSLWPVRQFAALELDGTVGVDLSPAAASKDKVCMAKYMPSISSHTETESIRQGTNTLSISLCRRKDPSCVASDANTFIMHIFHQSSERHGHLVDEPYVILFQQSAPFAIHAISQTPLWIHGRSALTNATEAIQYEGRESEIPANESEMFHVSGLSWRTHGQRYHGYIDDMLFLSFGIEDSRGGVIDVNASDLLQDLSFC